MEYLSRKDLKAAASSLGEYIGTLSHKKQQRLAEVLKPYYDLQEIEHAIQYYIPTRFISADKQNQENQLLIPFLLAKKNQLKHFLILAHSGFGKTTFLLNLFHTSAFDKKFKQPVELLPLRDANALNHLNDIKSPSKTLLLLDGLNEDPAAIINYEKRLNNLIEMTRQFPQVIITSRSNFFSKELIKPIDDYVKDKASSSLPFTTLYLSSFSEDEVRKYIKKKYFLWNRNKRKKAFEIIDQAPQLMEQPLLLSFVEDLLYSNKSYHHTFEIYEDLVKTWILQAADRQPIHRQENFFVSLDNLMKDISLCLYEKHIRGEPLFLSETEVSELINHHGFKNDELQSEGRSIVSFYEGHGYKFSHNSIMEYFIAREAFLNPNFFVTVSFAGLDQSQRFLQEMIKKNHMVRVQGGPYSLEKSNDSRRVILQDFYLGRYLITAHDYQLFCKAIEKDMPEPPDWGWEENAPILKVTWYDAFAYCNWFSQRTGLICHLPSEYEWEYAAKGGHKSRKHPFAGGKQLEGVGWYAKNAQRKTHPVGGLRSNALGIFDMSGNVWEWCNDRYYFNNQQKDIESPGRCIRGGSWLNHENSCKIEMRGFSKPDNKSNIIGFRIAVKQTERNS